MRASILILSLLVVLGLPLQAGPKKYRRHTSRHGAGVVVRVHPGAYHYGRTPIRGCSPWAPCGSPCAKHRSYKKYRKCVAKQRKKWHKRCRKNPYECRIPYWRF
jgi:hypothetical protein